MSGSEKQSNRNYSKFDNMSTSVLKEMLKQDSYLSKEEESDMDLILHIMEVIEKREKKLLSEKFTNVDDAWKSFNDYYRPSAAYGTSLYEDDENVDAALTSDIKPTPFKHFEHPPKNRIQGFLRAACVAAVVIGILFAGSMTAYALGYDIWGAVAQWSKETFSFTYTADSEEESSVPPHDIGACSDLQSALDEYGVTEKLVPKYIPEGYEQVEFNVSTESDYTSFAVGFIKDDRAIIVSITKNMLQSGAKYQKDEGDPEVYETGGVSHYIMTNSDNYKVVWVNGDFECSISGLAEKDELIKIIESIYEE